MLVTTDINAPVAILLVDDEATIVNALRSELSLQSHTVFTANSGKEALTLLEEQKIDILITDLNMPGMNGLELLTSASKIQDEIQTIVLTGFGDMKNAIEAVNRGAAGYMLKPPDLNELDKQITSCKKRIILGRTLKKRNEELELEVLKRTEAEQELQQAKVYTDTILASMADTLMVTTFDGMVMKVNRSASQLLRYSESEFLGCHVDQFCRQHVDDDEEVFSLGAELKAMLPAGGFDNLEAVFIAKNGLEIPVLISASVMRDDRGEETGIIVAAKDITDYKQAQKELREKEAQLIHAGRLTAMGEMASGIAHELNQPLTIIRMAAQNFGYRMAEGMLGEEDSLQISDKIMKQVDRAASIINLMRTFVRSEGKDDDDVIVDPSIPTLDALTFFREQYRVHDIELVTEITEGLPKIAIHPNHYEQIVVNLLSNARYAVNKKGDQQEEYKKQVIIKLSYIEEGAGSIILEVDDNGIGMSEEEQKRCWEPFFSTKEVGEGTGLGLYIIHSIIRERQGTIQMESVEGKGTKLTVQFPVVKLAT
ncbi:MAG: response regulator [Magnetococcales bacterium]|nr:response regulator [Magnetococcales bacterium]